MHNETYIKQPILNLIVSYSHEIFIICHFVLKSKNILISRDVNVVRDFFSFLRNIVFR